MQFTQTAFFPNFFRKYDGIDTTKKQFFSNRSSIITRLCFINFWKTFIRFNFLLYLYMYRRKFVSSLCIWTRQERSAEGRGLLFDTEFSPPGYLINPLLERFCKCPIQKEKILRVYKSAHIQLLYLLTDRILAYFNRH